MHKSLFLVQPLCRMKPPQRHVRKTALLHRRQDQQRGSGETVPGRDMARKAGGSYESKTGQLRRIDTVMRVIEFTDRVQIPMGRIAKVEIITID